MPLSHSLDTIGPLARSAEDCALILAAIAGFDPRDPLSSREPVGDYVPAKGRFRVALSSDWIERHAEPEVAAAVLAAAGVMRSIGAETVEVEPPQFDTLSAHCLVVMQSEASAQHARWMRERPADYSSAVRARLESGFAIPAAAYLEVLRLRAAWLERFCTTTLAKADLYLLPAMNVRVPTLEQTGPRGGADMPALLAELTRLTRWVNYLGVPALVIPCGFDSRGLPIGLQLVGRAFAEAALLAAGHAFQRETDWHRRARHSRADRKIAGRKEACAAPCPGGAAHRAPGDPQPRHAGRQPRTRRPGRRIPGLRSGTECHLHRSQQKGGTSCQGDGILQRAV